MAAPHRSRILNVAHRGNSHAAPENTLVAYREALAEGAELAECDVYLSKDGVVYLMHDADVKRTTNGEGAGTGFTMAELHALDAGSWKDPRYAGEPVPTLAALLRQHAADPMAIVVEIKQAGIAAPVVECIRAEDAIERTVVISFSRDECHAVRLLEPRLPVLFLVSIPKEPERRARLLDEALVAGWQGVDAHAPTLDEAFVRSAHARGLTVWAWTCDQAEQWESLAAMGIDGVTTNRPGAFRAWAGS